MDFFYSHISNLSKKLLNEVLDSGFLNEGEMVEKFEEELHNILELNNILTTNSCTVGLECSLRCCNVKGKEVITTPQSFVATSLSILNTGGIPVFADINENGNITPESIKEKLTDKTAAVICVHYGGVPCDIYGIKNVIGNIPLIEDAAHCLGGKINDIPIGHMLDNYPSRFCVFSLQAIKTLCAGDGGIICCKHKEDFDRVEKMKWFGMKKRGLKRLKTGERDIDITERGIKGNLNNIAAALALGNLYDFKDRLEKRRQNAKLYIRNIKHNNITIPNIPYDTNPTYWLFPLLVRNRNRFIDYMKDNKIPVSVVDGRLDKYTIFGGIDINLVGQNKFSNEVICIPIHENLSDKEINYIVETINKWQG